MSKPDELLVEIASLVESEHSNQMSLTVVVAGAVITGRLAPEALWRRRVAEVLKDSDRLAPFAPVFDADGAGSGPPPEGTHPTHLHFHLARIIQGSLGLPETGGMYRIPLQDVSAWSIGDLSYSDH
ncbi:Gas vesicle protein OS=Streptomyces alboniger OX=132473 GN=CP975_22345 PE=4 SV=1 [Streptomyces alboniger]